MPAITFENAPVVQSLLSQVALEKPAVGRLVRITYGKHRGKIGVVQHHMVSRFKRPFRYGNEMQHLMTETRGRNGYVVRVRTESGEEFWCDADYTMVCLG